MRASSARWAAFGLSRNSNDLSTVTLCQKGAARHYIRLMTYLEGKKVALTAARDQRQDV